MKKRQYDLIVLPTFRDDLKETVGYIAHRLNNPRAADRLVGEVKKAIERRRSCAESFQKCYSRHDRKNPYYRIRVKNYTILYVVKGNTMEVRHMVYNRRDISNYI